MQPRGPLRITQQHTQAHTGRRMDFRAMSEKPRKRPVNTPASGIPASNVSRGDKSGIPARGGPAAGAGWGGDASGVSAQPWGEDNPPAPHNGKAATIRERLAPHVETAIAKLAKISGDDGHPRQLDAARDILDRSFGKAVQPTVTADLNKPASDASTEALLDIARRELGLTIGGEAE